VVSINHTFQEYAMISGNHKPQDLKEMQSPVRDLHKQFHALVEPLRPDLFKYFLRLTGSPFDAEDFVQETLARAFGRLHQFYQPLETRRYVFRIATNLWIDQFRRACLVAFEPLEEDQPANTIDPVRKPEVVEAWQRVVAVLEPRQRVAILLKEVFDFSIAEISEFLMTTPSAVKGLLNRGRSRLRQVNSQAGEISMDEDRLRLAALYAERLDAQDWDGLAVLLREDATMHLIGCDEEFGRDYIRKTSLEDASKDMLPGHRAELVILDGEPLVLWLFRPDDGPEAIRDVLRVFTAGEAILQVRSYWFCPDVIREVGRRLNRRTEPMGAYTI
jgi:RNA polymerase sigma-70 factor, ECF subfamily